MVSRYLLFAKGSKTPDLTYKYPSTRTLVISHCANVAVECVVTCAPLVASWRGTLRPGRATGLARRSARSVATPIETRMLKLGSHHCYSKYPNQMWHIYTIRLILDDGR